MTRFTRTFLLTASAAGALAFASAASAQHQHDCLDASCEAVALFVAADTPAGATAASLASPKYGAWGFDASGMDRSVKPGDDFFRYADGAWFDRTEIPADRVRYGNFDKLAELSEHRLHAILEDVAK